VLLSLSLIQFFKDLGDEKTNVPCSGIFQTKLTQKGANAVWFRNRKDEGIVFAPYFTPFPIPAMALLYTAVSYFFESV
jgi:hypothetical protein